MPPFENDGDMIGLMGNLTLDDGGIKEIPLPLTGVAVEADVVDFIAEVKISQCYENTEASPIEAVYHFPVDEAAAVCGCQAEYEDGTIVKGVVKETAKAREEYKQALSKGKQANLLEATKRDIFTLNVGNVPAGGFVKIKITYVTSLKAQDDAVAFVLPTYIAPRYSPRDEAISSKEAQAVSPPSSSIKFFGLDINIQFSCQSNIKSISSPTHPSEPTFSTHIEGKSGRVSLQDISMDRELVVFVTEEQPHQPRASIEVAPDGSMVGFVTLFPKLEFRDLAREFVFIVDRSGSMRGRYGEKSQIQHASDALLLFLRTLPPSCTFNVVGFGSSFSALFSTPRKYNDETLEEASQHVTEMDADMGGTEILRPLTHVLQQKCPPSVQRHVFILTDGQVSNDLQVFDTIRQHCSTGQCRVFSLGIGAGVSRHLVQGMARAGRGTARFVEGGDEQSLRAKVLGQLKQALQPALDQVSIDWAFPTTKAVPPQKPQQVTTVVKTLLGYRSPDADEPPAPIPQEPQIYPSVNPPVFNNERFLSFATFAKGANAVPESVTVKCNSPDGLLEHKISISDDDKFQGTIAHKLAARVAISEYEDGRKGRRYGQQGTTAGKIVSRSEALRLALENSIVSEQTSFMAVREYPVVDVGTKTVKHVIPQYMPEPRFGASISSGRGGRDGAEKKRCRVVHWNASRKSEERERGVCGDQSLLEPVVCMVTDLSGRVGRGGGSRGHHRHKAVAYHPPAASSAGKENLSGKMKTDIMAELRTAEAAMPMCAAGVVSNDRDRLMQCSSGPVSGMTLKMSRKSAKKSKRKSSKDDAKRSRASSSDRLMQLCSLQKADGSFALDSRLADAVGVTFGAMSNMATTFHDRVQEQLVFGTLLAVSAMRGAFAKQKDVWELSETKAVGFLSANGVAAADVDWLVSAILLQLRKEPDWPDKLKPTAQRRTWSLFGRD